MSVEKLVQAMNVIHRCRGEKEALILLILADQHDALKHKNPAFANRCLPTIPVLIEKSHLSRSSVTRAVNHLEIDGFCEVRRSYGEQHEYVLTLDKQLGLRAVPTSRPKRNTGYRRLGRKSETSSSLNPLQAEIGSEAESDVEPTSQGSGFGRAAAPEPISACDRLPTSQGSGFDVLTDLLPVRTYLQPTATAAPRLPMPIEVRSADPAVVALRVAKLRRRVAGYAIGLLTRPGRGVALIQEPVTTESTLHAATLELCAVAHRHDVAAGRQSTIEHYRATDPKDGLEYLFKTVSSVWWRKTAYGQAVINGQALRPRDLARPPKKGR